MSEQIVIIKFISKEVIQNSNSTTLSNHFFLALELQEKIKSCKIDSLSIIPDAGKYLVTAVLSNVIKIEEDI